MRPRPMACEGGFALLGNREGLLYFLHARQILERFPGGHAGSVRRGCGIAGCESRHGRNSPETCGAGGSLPEGGNAAGDVSGAVFGERETGARGGGNGLFFEAGEDALGIRAAGEKPVSGGREIRVVLRAGGSHGHAHAGEKERRLANAHRLSDDGDEVVAAVLERGAGTRREAGGSRERALSLHAVGSRE